MADVQALLQALAAANVASGASASDILLQLQAQAKTLLSSDLEAASGSAHAEESSQETREQASSTPTAAASNAPAQARSAANNAHSHQTDHTLDVAILQASPLVLLGNQTSTDPGGNAVVTPRAVAPLELATERRLIIKSLRESTRALRLVVAPATLDSLQRVWMVSAC